MRQRPNTSIANDHEGFPVPNNQNQPFGANDTLAMAVSRFGEREGLSTREREILDLAAHGLADKEISRQLGVAYTTVKSYWSRIYLKLSAQNRQSAISKLLVSLAMSRERRTTSSGRASYPQCRPIDVIE